MLREEEIKKIVLDQIKNATLSEIVTMLTGAYMDAYDSQKQVSILNEKLDIQRRRIKQLRKS